MSNLPAVVRIRNVDATGFDIRLQEWNYQDGVHASETVSYLVLEHGNHVLENGILVEAGRFDTSKTTFHSVTFRQPFYVTPVVLTSIISFNEEEAVTSRQKQINTTLFQFRLQEQELNEQTHAKETVSYIALEPTSGVIDGLTVEVGSTGAVVDHLFKTIQFTQVFEAVPVFLADMQTTEEGDTAKVRWKNKTLNEIEVKIAEEQSLDSETEHLGETVGYVAIR